MYVVCKLIGSAHEKTKQKKYEAYNAEYNRQKETKEKGGFICPICGKQVLDNNYSIRIWSKEQIAYSVKICSSCNDRYYLSKFGKKNETKADTNLGWRITLYFCNWIGIICFDKEYYHRTSFYGYYRHVNCAYGNWRNIGLGILDCSKINKCF